MSIPRTIAEYLDRGAVTYEVIEHPRTATSLETARVAGVPAPRLAKAVLLKDEEDFLLAVLPADRDLSLAAVATVLGHAAALADEDELREVFPDCKRGAVPAIGVAYGLRMLVDRRLRQEPDVYFESGDHEKLIHLEEAAFEQVLEGATFESISNP